jgi:peptide/nickel transport system permease protein
MAGNVTTATPRPRVSRAELAAVPKRVIPIRLMPWLPLSILLLFLIMAIFAPFITQYDPQQQNLIERLTPPFWVDGGSTAHIFGTDSFGRDIFARLLYGARVSFLVATFAIVIAVAIGLTMGIIAGYVGGTVDAAIMRLVDILLALPTILVALVVAVAVGPSFQNLVLLLGLLIWPRIARLIRGETIALKQQDFVRYSNAIGVPKRTILRRHVTPNVLPTLLVLTTLEVGHVILVEASLSFLGAGLPAETVTWGKMIAEGRALVATGWWVALFPGLAITITVLCCNAFGDWLRDYMDPKTRQA